MFDNIGGKIKALAAVITWLGIVSCCMLGLVMLLTGEAAGFVIMIVGSLCSWIGSMTLYGFGQLIENTDILVKNLKSNPAAFSGSGAAAQSGQAAPVMQTAPVVFTTPVEDVNAPWVCPVCGRMLGAEYRFCTNCGATRNSTAKAAPEPWICSDCGTENQGNVKTCQGCGVTKAWSDAHKH